MSDFWVCDECGAHVNNRDDNHHDYCPGPSVTRAEVAEMIAEAIEAERERLLRRVQAAILRGNGTSALVELAIELEREDDPE